MVAKTPNLQSQSFVLEVRRFIRANASTSLATGIEWILVSVLVGSHVSYLIAAAFGSLVGAVMDFSLKRQWAFIRRGTGSLRAESARYVAVSAISLGLNLAVAYLLVHMLHVMAVPGVIAASIVVGALWNYPTHRLFVFPDVAARVAVRSAASRSAA